MGSVAWAPDLEGGCTYCRVLVLRECLAGDTEDVPGRESGGHRPSAFHTAACGEEEETDLDDGAEGSRRLLTIRLVLQAPVANPDLCDWLVDRDAEALT